MGMMCSVCGVGVDSSGVVWHQYGCTAVERELPLVASSPDPRDAEIARLKARAEKAETEVDAIAWERGVIEDRLTQALAACAEMRAALEAVATANTRRLGESRRAIEAARALLSRPDLGAGWASPEDTAQMVGALQMVESDGEFDSLHEVTRKFVVDVLALLKAEVETAKAWQGAAVLRNYDAVRILTEEIGAPGPENIDETARRAVMVIRAHKRALAAGPAALRRFGFDGYELAAFDVEAAQAAAMREGT